MPDEIKGLLVLCGFYAIIAGCMKTGQGPPPDPEERVRAAVQEELESFARAKAPQVHETLRELGNMERILLFGGDDTRRRGPCEGDAGAPLRAGVRLPWRGLR